MVSTGGALTYTSTIAALSYTGAALANFGAAPACTAVALSYTGAALANIGAAMAFSLEWENHTNSVEFKQN